MAKKIDKRSKKSAYSREIIKVKPLGRPDKRPKLPLKSPPPVKTSERK